MTDSIRPFVAGRKFIYTITLLAFALSAHSLSGESIWVDEAATLHTAEAEPATIIPLMIDSGEYHPPLHYFLWHYWIEITGRSEFALRLLAVFFGLGATLLTYKLGRFLFGAPVGALGSLLVACSGFHVSFSQTVRTYILLEMTAVLSCYWFARWLNRPTRNNAIYYLVSTLLLIYTHAFGAFVILAQNAFVAFQLWHDRRGPGWRLMSTESASEKPLHARVIAGDSTAKTRLESNVQAVSTITRWVLLQAAVILLFAPWLPVILFLARQVGDVIPSASLAQALGTYVEFTWSPAGFVIALTTLTMGGYVLLRQFIVQLSSSARGKKTASRQPGSPGSALRINGALLTTTIMLGSWGIPLFLSYAIRPMYLSRYVISALPPFYLLIAWTALKVLRPGVGWSLAGLLLIAQASGLYSLYRGVNNEQWREATRYIDSNAGSGDLLLFYTGFGQYSFDYYSQRGDLAEVQLGPVDGPELANEALAARPNQPVVWLILVYRDETPFKALMQKRGYTLTSDKDFFRIKLLKYEKISPYLALRIATSFIGRRARPVSGLLGGEVGGQA